MNRAILIGGVLVLLAGGLFFYVSQNPASPSGTASSIPTTGDTNTGQNTPTQVASAPSAITDSATTPFNNSAIVTGNVTPNGALTSYWYEYGTTANLGSQTPSQTVGSGYSAIPAPGYILTLTKDTTYYFRLVAQNQFGKTVGAQYTLHTTLNTPTPVGSTPTTQTVAATGISSNTAALLGQVTPNRASTIYWFEYGVDKNLGSVSALQGVGSGTAVVPVSLTIQNLTPSTTYYFRLNAQNQFGTINGTILSFKTLGPTLSGVPVVTTQLASPIATTTATVRGTVNPYNAQTTYWFEYSTDAGFASRLLQTTQKHSVGAGAATVAVEASIAGLKANTTYYYRTVAQNTAGTVRGDSKSLTTK